MTYVNRCDPCEIEFEWLARSYESPNPACPLCHGVTSRTISAPAIVWSKPLGDYADPKSENYHQRRKAGGHWAMETNKQTGAVTKTFIDTPQAQAEYCKRNGLIDPKNLPNNLSVAADGKSYEKNNVSEI